VALAAETDTKGDVRQGRCMSVAAAERNAARRDARARAEAAPAAASMTLYTCEKACCDVEGAGDAKHGGARPVRFGG